MRNSFKILFALGVVVVMMSGCKKDNYLSGGSLHNPITSLNNMDYLKGNAFRLFDTAAVIIERLNLVSEVNSAKTFFAFTDYSILNTINSRLTARQGLNPTATYTLDSLIKDISADSIRQYMFNETIELETTAELKATPYTSLGKTTMGVVKQLTTDAIYLTRTQAPTYLLFFVKIRGDVDEPGVIPPLNENDIRVQCQTTGIKTSNGATTMHVLVNPHQFVRF